MTVVCVCKVSIKNTTCEITDIGKVKALEYMIISHVIYEFKATTNIYTLLNHM